MRVKSETLRQAILDIAADVFSEHGFEHASMSEISSRVGGSKKTLYSYFASKEELFLEVMHQYARSHMRNVDAEMDPTKDVQTTLQNFGECLLSLTSTPRMISVQRVVYSEAGRFDGSRQYFERGPQKGVSILSAYFEQCVELGKLQPCNTVIAAHHFLGILRSEIMEPLLMAGCPREDLPPIPEVVERAVAVFLRAYAAP